MSTSAWIGSKCDYSDESLTRDVSEEKILESRPTSTVDFMKVRGSTCMANCHRKLPLTGVSGYSSLNCWYGKDHPWALPLVKDSVILYNRIFIRIQK